jgi:hypothetical protein
MEVNIPEEVQEKLKIIEKEAVFSNKITHPDKILLISGILFFVITAIIIPDKNYFKSALFLVIGIFNIAGYFEYKKTYKLHSYARDIINYYHNRESSNTV